jgi:hypothetical protein
MKHHYGSCDGGDKCNCDAVERSEYDKEAIIQILMRRDNLTRADAETEVRETQIEIDNVKESLDEIIQIIEDNLGLEPDYLEAFVEF